MDPIIGSEELFSRMPGVGSLIFLLVQNQEYTKRFDNNLDSFQQYTQALRNEQNYDRLREDKQADLNKRYMEYLAIRDKIMNWDLPEAQKDALLVDYMSRHFSAHELLKVKELDKAHGGMDH